MVKVISVNSPQELQTSYEKILPQGYVPYSNLVSHQGKLTQVFVIGQSPSEEGEPGKEKPEMKVAE